MRILLGFGLLSLVFTGCTYPIYKTLQPESKVFVLDKNKTPLTNAKVHLQTEECIPCKHSEEIQLSNKEGIAHFKSKKEWRNEILIIHGSKFFRWKWCVEKEGYKTILSSNKFESHRTFILEKGTTLPCNSPYLVSEFKIERFNDKRLQNQVHSLITEMLSPNKATRAYVKLEKLGKNAVPYIVLQMDDFRELPVKSLMLNTETEVKVQEVTDALSIILTKITGQQFSPNFDEKSLDEKILTIYRWLHGIKNWGLSQIQY